MTLHCHLSLEVSASLNVGRVPLIVGRALSFLDITLRYNSRGGVTAKVRLNGGIIRRSTP